MLSKSSGLVLTIVEADSPMGRVHMLADESGAPIKGQTAVSIQHGVDELSTVTVTLIIDGKNVRIGKA